MKNTINATVRKFNDEYELFFKEKNQIIVFSFKDGHQTTDKGYMDSLQKVDRKEAQNIINKYNNIKQNNDTELKLVSSL